MSKMGNWVIEMQQDAYHMTLAQFIDCYGFAHAEIWHDAHFGDDRDYEPDLETLYVEMDDGA